MNHTNCQFRDKHTVGGIVFYKHAFLVPFNLNIIFFLWGEGGDVDWTYYPGTDNIGYVWVIGI